MDDPKEQLYISYRKGAINDHTYIDGYAYGEEWVAMALYCDDMKYSTPEEAKAAWERWKTEHKKVTDADGNSLWV